MPEEQRNDAEGASGAESMELHQRLAGDDALFAVGAGTHRRGHDVSRLQDFQVRRHRLEGTDAGASEVVGHVRQRHDEKYS